MAAHSSVPVWRIPWTEEPSRLQSIGSQRVGDNWMTEHTAYMLLLLGASQAALVVKNLPAYAGDVRDVWWIPGSRRSPGGGNGNPLQYFCLENPMDKGSWRATVIGVPRVGHNWSNLAHTHYFYLHPIQFMYVNFFFFLHCMACRILVPWPERD